MQDQLKMRRDLWRLQGFTAAQAQQTRVSSRPHLKPAAESCWHTSSTRAFWLANTNTSPASTKVGSCALSHGILAASLGTTCTENLCLSEKTFGSFLSK